MLKIKDLTAGYKNGPDIIHHINMHVDEGEIVTIIGPNGAGKSTLLKSIFGLTDIRSGSIVHGSRELRNLPTKAVLKSGITFVSQGNNIFPDLTVEENLEIAGYTLISKKELALKKEEVMHFFPQLGKMRKNNV